MNAPERAVQTAAQMIPLQFIVASRTNPRKHFDDTQLGELTESVKRHGVLQPILVRSATATTDPRVLWELVAGERRYRAAKAAGLEEIPAVVRSLTDIEALEVQVIENLQRADLHPIEEADGYEQLLKLQAYTAEELAAKVGKSKAYVYARLKLTALTPAARNAFFDGKLNASTALLIARIPVARLQDEATKEITQTGYQGEPRYSVRAAAHHLQERYMLRLADAPFPHADAKLVPKAGACAACPKRTGNQPELFGDVKGADVCTDPDCFDAKKTAHVTRLRDEASAKGLKVISGKEAKKIIEHGARCIYNSAYVALDEENYQDGKNRTYRQLLGKAAPTPTLVESPSGKLIEVIAKKDIADILKEKLPNTGRVDDSQKKREAKAKLETAIRVAIYDAIAEKHPGTMTPVDAALIADALFDRTDHECVKRILKRWEPEAFAKTKEHGMWDLKKAFAKRIETLTAVDLVRLMVQLALANEIHVGLYGGGSVKPENLLAAAARLDIDHAAIRRTLSAAVKTKAAAKTARAKKSAAKPRATKPTKEKQ